MTVGPATTRLRTAVRGWLEAHVPGTDPAVAVGLSGGADSLALTAAAVAVGADVTALVVDHRLQPGSAQVAEAAAEVARGLGADAVVLPVSVGREGGLEAAARAARYRALEDARSDRPVLLAHTLDDQAETVLLGLARGSGARSLQGMAAFRPPWGRPLLGVRRADTRASCAELGLSPHDDPANLDPAYARVRLRREALPLLEEILGGGVAQALARTAALLRQDQDVLVDAADRLLADAREGEAVRVADLAAAPPALRVRALRQWLLDVGARHPSAVHLEAVDALITDWHGQGGQAVPGGDAGVRLVVRRAHGKLEAEREPRR